MPVTRSSAAGSRRPEARGRPSAAASVDSSNALTVEYILAKPTETNDTWWRMAWQMEIVNQEARPIQLDQITIEFLDEDSFVVNSANEYRVVMPGSSSRTLTGSELIRIAVAPGIAVVRAKLEWEGGFYETPTDPLDKLPVRFATRHRHFASAPEAVLSLFEDRIAFDEAGGVEHDFSISTSSITRLNASAFSAAMDLFQLTLHFSEDTSADDKITFNADPMMARQLSDFIDRFCPSAANDLR